MAQRPIANEITGEDQDSYCSVCGDDTLVVKIAIKIRWGNCGNKAFLCQHCLARMMEEIEKLKI